PRSTVLTSVEPPVFERLGEAFLAADIFARGFGPCFPVGEQVGAALGVAAITRAFLIDPSCDGVFVCKIFVGCLSHYVWGGQAAALPFEASFDGPLQNTTPLGAQLVWKLDIGLGYFDGEGQEVEAAADGFVDAPQPWFMVAGDHQFELRNVGKK